MMNEEMALSLLKFIFVIGGLFVLALVAAGVFSWYRKKGRKHSPTHLCHCCGADGWWNRRIIGDKNVYLCATCEASLSFEMTGLHIREIRCAHHGRVLFPSQDQG